MKINIKRVYILSLISLSVIGFFSILSLKFLSSDGANYLYDLINCECLFSYQRGRTAAHYILKTPGLLYIKTGLRNFNTLAYLFGAPFYIQMFLGLLISNNFLTEKNKKLMIFPILSTFAFSLNTEYAIESEAIFLNSFFWPVLFYLLEFKKRDWKLYLFILLVVSLSFSYETFLICAIPLTLTIKRNNFISLKLKLFSYVYLLLISIFQFYNIVNHEFPENVIRFNTSLFKGLFGILVYSDSSSFIFNFYFIYVLILFCFIMYLINVKRKHEELAILFISISIAVLSISYAFFFPNSISRTSQYMTRTLTSFAPFFLSLSLILFIKKEDVKNLKIIEYILILLIISQTVVSLRTTAQWILFRNKLNISLRNGKGKINEKETDFYRSIKSKELSRNYVHWSLPLYSVFLNDMKRVDSVVYSTRKGYLTKKILESLKENDNKLNEYGFEIKLNGNE